MKVPSLTLWLLTFYRLCLSMCGKAPLLSLRWREMFLEPSSISDAKLL
jgi:hypothetical protein